MGRSRPGRCRTLFFSSHGCNAQSPVGHSPTSHVSVPDLDGALPALHVSVLPALARRLLRFCAGIVQPYGVIVPSHVKVERGVKSAVEFSSELFLRDMVGALTALAGDRSGIGIPRQRLHIGSLSSPPWNVAR